LKGDQFLASYSRFDEEKSRENLNEGQHDRCEDYKMPTGASIHLTNPHHENSVVGHLAEKKFQIHKEINPFLKTSG
jgi:hypothetical protein